MRVIGGGLRQGEGGEEFVKVRWLKWLMKEMNEVDVGNVMGSRKCWVGPIYD